jgi:hypothetical protein
MWDLAFVAVGLLALTGVFVGLAYVAPRFPDICLYCWFWPANIRRALLYQPRHRPATILLRVWGLL